MFLETQKAEKTMKHKSSSFAAISRPNRLIAALLFLLLFCLSSIAVMIDRDQEGEGGAPSMQREYTTTAKSKMHTLAYSPSTVRDVGEAAEIAADESEMHVMLQSAQTSSNTDIGSDFMQNWNNAMKDIPSTTKKQMLVHEGYLSLNMWKGELQEKVDKIESLIKQDSRAYIENKSNSKDGYGGHDLMTVNIQCRIPSEIFHKTVEDIQDLVGRDMVVSATINTRDVTDEYIDASSRADTLEASKNALQSLLLKAENVNEVMNVQRELTRLTQQMESQRSRAMYLKKQSVSTPWNSHVV
jgi:hypothetical protein